MTVKNGSAASSRLSTCEKSRTGPRRLLGHYALPQADRRRLVESAFDSEEDRLLGDRFPDLFHRALPKQAARPVRPRLPV
jgi:hypothetical protein